MLSILFLFVSTAALSSGLRSSFIQLKPATGRCLASGLLNSFERTVTQSSGVISIETCAQFAKEQSSATYVSWKSASSTCEAYSTCNCAAGGACREDGGWTSAAVSSLLTTSTEKNSISKSSPFHYL